MKKTLLGIFLGAQLFSLSQIDGDLNSLSLERFPHFTEITESPDFIENDELKQKGDPVIVLFKPLYIQKHQGVWLYDNDSCAIKRLRANKMAYFSTGTQAIYCGLSFDANVKNRKTFRAVSYPVLGDLKEGDTLRFTLTILADRDSKFQPEIYTSDKIKVRRDLLRNGNYLTHVGAVPEASLNDDHLVQNRIEIPITSANEGIKWVHIVNNEDEQHKGFIIENDHKLGGTMDDEYLRVYFKNDSYQLNEEGKVILDKVVHELRSSNAIVLRGYADPSGQKEYNMKLAENRAKAVMDYLIKKGVEAARVRIEEFDIGKNKLAKENRICTILVL